MTATTVETTASGTPLDKLKSSLPVALGIYPIFVGLYAAGLFWNIPKDVIGAFGIEDFLFRCSIIYASLLGGLLVPLLIITSVYSVIMPQEAELGTSTRSSQYIKWPTMTKAERIRVSFVSLCLIVLVVFANYNDPPIIESTPDGFLEVLLILFFLGIVGRPFIAEASWRVAVFAYVLSWVIAAPLVAGYSDSKPDRNGPNVKFKNTICNLVLIGKDAVLGKCASSFIIIPRDKIERPLVWNQSP